MMIEILSSFILVGHGGFEIQAHWFTKPEEEVGCHLLHFVSSSILAAPQRPTVTEHVYVSG